MMISKIQGPSGGSTSTTKQVTALKMKNDSYVLIKPFSASEIVVTDSCPINSRINDICNGLQVIYPNSTLNLLVF